MMQENRSDSGIEITQLLPLHTPQVSNLHLETWADAELSTKLGRRFVNAFYNHVAQSPHARGFIALASGEVVAYVCAFSDYPTFNRLMLRQSWVDIGLSVLNALLHKRLTIGDVLAAAKDDRKMAVLHEPQYHLGALAMAKPFRKHPSARGLMRQLIQKAHGYLRECGAHYVWGATDATNLPVHLLFANSGYYRVDTVSYRKRSIWIFEAELNEATFE